MSKQEINKRLLRIFVVHNGAVLFALCVGFRPSYTFSILAIVLYFFALMYTIYQVAAMCFPDKYL